MPASQLLERDLELATVETLLERTSNGRGGRLLIEGPAGIGKSALLEVALARAQAAGMVCLLAQGSEQAAQVAFAAARAALGPLWPGDSVPGKSAAPDDHSGEAEAASAISAAGARAVLELAEQSAVAVCIDDVQWLDAASVRWLAVLCERSAGSRVALVLTLRPGEKQTEMPGLAEVLDQRGALVVRPAPLSAAAVREMLAGVLGEPVDTGLADACLAETAGNPYLVDALACGLRQAGVGAGEATTYLREIGSRVIARSVSQRVAAVGAGAQALIEVAAVVGEIGEPGELAQLAGLTPAVATDSAEALARAGLLRSVHPVEIAHPLVAAAIRAQLPAAAREQLARSAAAMLMERGDSEEAAARLLALPPRADRGVVEILLAAAARAVARGGPDVAIALLRRAVGEPPDPAREGEVWRALGLALLACGDARAVDALQQALDHPQPGDAGVGTARLLARALTYTNQPDRAIAVLDETRAKIAGEDRGQADELELLAAFAVSFDAGHRSEYQRRMSRWSGREPRGELAAAMLAGELAVESLLAARPSAETVALAVRALAAGTLLARARSQHSRAVLVLAYAGRTRAARSHLQDAIVHARGRGDTVALATALVLHGETRRLEGDMIATESDSRTGIELMPGGELGLRFMLRGLLESLVEQGRAQAAAELLRDSELTGDLPEALPSVGLLHARARVRLACGLADAALADLRRAGAIAALVGLKDPVSVPWRLQAAEVLLERGDREQACELVERHLGLARETGLDAAVGTALRVRGVIVGGDSGARDLEAAVTLLEGSFARLELARAQAALGIQLTSSDPVRARTVLDSAAQLAAELGASVLAERAETALAAAGARRRRAARRGIDSLTPAERRASRLAAEGMSNREIAATLVLSEKTIESHMTAVFRKLGLRSRAELQRALAGSD